MEDKGVTISIINNNPGLVIKANTKEEYESLKGWAIPAFKSIREAYNKYVTPTASTPKEDVCPTCGKLMVYKETATGKKMMKCSGSGWDAVNKRATGCTQKPIWINEDNDRAPYDMDKGDEVRDEPNW